MEIILKYFTDFTDQQIKQFRLLERLYKEWNSKINVISRKDIDALYEKHVLHSLSIAAVFDFADGTRIIDIGTGGGFPGIPLAIFFPQVNFHLIDSIAKKIKVVESIAGEIGLENVSCQHTRAEEIKNARPDDPVGPGKFDFAVSRAVAPLKELWKWSKPLLKLGVGSRELGVRSRESGVGSQESRLTTHNSQLIAPGLICLKGGDLAKEIGESRTRPRLMEIFEIFPEEYFKEKYIIYVPH